MTTKPFSLFCNLRRSRSNTWLPRIEALSMKILCYYIIVTTNVLYQKFHMHFIIKLNLESEVDRLKTMIVVSAYMEQVISVSSRGKRNGTRDDKFSGHLRYAQCEEKHWIYKVTKNHVARIGRKRAAL